MKKFTRVLLTLTLTLSTCMLSACNFDLFSKTPTAEELLNQKLDSSATYIDADVEMEIGMSMDMGALMGEATGDASTKMNVEIALDANVKGTKDVQHVSGDMDMNMFGMDMEVPYESYVSVLDDTAVSYTYDADSKQWFVVETDVEDSELMDLSMFTESLGSEVFESYELKEAAKEDTTYTVTGVIAMEHLSNLLGSDAGSILGDLDTDEFDLSDLKLNTEIIFDKETLQPISYEMVFDPETMDFKDLEAEVTALSIKMKVNEMSSDKTVEIPKSVIDSAISEDEMYVDSDFEFEFDESDVIYEDVFEPEVEFETEVEVESEIEKPEVEETITEETEKVETPVTETGSSELSENWYDMEFLYNGNKFQVPVNYKDFSAKTGWSMNLADYGYEDGYILNKGDKTYGTVELDNAKFTEQFSRFKCTVGFINNSDKQLDITESSLWSIDLSRVNGYKVVDSYDEIELSKGIKWGSTLDEIYAAYGDEPKEVYESEKYTSLNYYYRDDVTKSDIYLRLYVYNDTGLGEIEYKIY